MSGEKFQKNEVNPSAPASGSDNESKVSLSLQSVDIELPLGEQMTNEQLFENNLKMAQSIGDVLGYIYKYGGITSPHGRVYSKEYLMPIIEGLEGSDDPNLQSVTNTHGLRDTVRRILMNKNLDPKYK